MMKVNILASLFTVALSLNALASENSISSVKHLRKIKMRLISNDLDTSDYTFIAQTEARCRKASDFETCKQNSLRERIKLYLKSESFVGRGVEFASNLLGVRPSSIPAETLSASQYIRDEDSARYGRINDPASFAQDSLGRLAWKLFAENLSWTSFFTMGELEVTESDYFDLFIPSQLKPLKGGTAAKINLNNPDLAAGFMVTPRFQTRYFNTPINEGRKRAAGILRVAFCDSMFPAIERGEEHKNLEDLIALGRAQGASSANSSQLHGVRRDCAQCHAYRGLDHMAWTFRSTEMALDSKPSPGRFTYIRTNGQIIDIPVRGIGHLAKVITEQPEFIDCQVRNFWSQFVGPVRHLDEYPEKQRQLVEVYKSVNGQVQDFITQLMLRPEIAMIELPRPQLNPIFGAASTVLKNCNQCHQGLIPSFTTLPMTKDGTNLTNHFVGRIIERLALKPYSKSEMRSMPPQSSAWQPKTEDLKAIQRWIESGAPDAYGVRHLNDADLKSLGVKNE